MSAPSISTMAAHLIEHCGANPDSHSAALLAGMMMDRLRWQDGSSAPVVVTRDGHPAVDTMGRPKTVGELVSDFRRELPQLFTASKVASPVTAAAMHGVTGLTARAAAEHAASQKRQTTGERPNPWAAGTCNLTEQVRLEARDPARAAELKAEAGAR